MAEDPHDLVIGADDRTGAWEAAGAIADAVGHAVAVVTGVAGLERVTVVDLATRHLPTDVAADRAAVLEGVPSRRSLHKIDSTLRGNWAHELVARHRRADRPVLVVPALPALGRVCVAGIVTHDGVPVHEGPAGSDARGAATTSRPAELLDAAGAPDISEIAGDDALATWLGSPHGVAVADASTDDDLARIARRWTASSGVLLAGTSAATAAGAAGGAARPVTAPPSFGARRVLIVSGSLHPAARRQVARVVDVGAVRHIPSGPVPGGDGVLVLETEATRAPVPPSEATRTAGALATATRSIVASWQPDAVVVLGGDTAAAVLGDRPVTVHGTLASGTAWARIDGRVVLIRAGGFGDEGALADLVWATLSL